MNNKDKRRQSSDQKSQLTESLIQNDLGPKSLLKRPDNNNNNT